MIKEIVSSFFRPDGANTEEKILQDKEIGIGIAGGAIAGIFLSGELEIVRTTFGRRGVTCHNLTEVQSKWLQEPLDRNEQRPPYNAYGGEKFPNANCYLVLGLSDGDFTFAIYGASFRILKTVSCPMLEAVGFDALKQYLKCRLASNLALAMRQWPEDFTGQLTYSNHKREISAVFTLPSLR